MGKSLDIPSVVKGDWTRLRVIIDKLKHLRLGPDSSPTYAGLTLSGLTAGRVLFAGTGGLLSDDGELLWNNTTKILTATGLIVTGSSVHGLNSAVFQPTTDSTTFFQVLDADGGTPILNIDTTNERVGINKVDPDQLLHIFGGNIIVEETDTSANIILNRTDGKSTSLSAGRLSSAFRFDNTGIFSIQSQPAANIIAGTGGGVDTIVIVEAAPENSFIIKASGNIGVAEALPETLTEWTHAQPYLTLHNSTHEDTDGGGESKLIFKREDGAGTETVCFRFEASHDGSGANDQLGKGVWSVNTGAGLVEVLRINSLGHILVGSFSSPLDVGNTREYGTELHYFGNNYNVTAIRARAQLVTTDTSASAQGALLQAANNDNINAGVLQGALIEAIGKATINAATITMMRGCLVNTEWSAKDTVTDLRVLHVRTHTRDAATEGYVSGTGYGIYIENEAVGGNGQALDAGIYFKGTNLSAGNKAFTYGIDFSGATYGTADIRLSGSGVINNSSGYTGLGTVTPTRKLTIIENGTDAIFIRHTDGANASTLGIGINTTTGFAYIQSRNDAAGVTQPLTFWVGNTRVVTISTDNVVGIGTSTPHSSDTMLHVYSGDSGVTVPWTSRHNLIVEDSDTVGISILTADNKVGSLVWGSPSDNNHAFIDCEQALGIMLIAAGGVTTISLTTGVTAIGDAGITNYTQFAVDGSISQTGTARIDWTKITASGVSIRNGHGTTSDSVSDLQTAHDGNVYTLSEESGETPGMDIEVGFAGVTAFNWVQILGRYEQATAGHGITIMLEVAPFNGSAWHRYDFMQDQGADLTNEEHSFFIPDDSAYINSGVVKVRFVHEMIGTSSNHDLVIDVCALYQ